MNIDDFLEHYGVKGMRWGVRRSDKELRAASKSKGDKTPAADDAIEAVRTAKKIKSAGSTNVATSKELQQLVDRMNLEQRYVSMTTQSKPEIKKGQSFAAKVIQNEADNIFLKGQPGPVASGIGALLSSGSGKHKAVAGKRKKS